VLSAGRAEVPGTPDDWRESAACAEVDPELFYPETGGPWNAAKRICAGCEVRAACLEHALSTREVHGVWGGTTPNERSRMLAGAGQPRLTRSAPRPQRRSECNRGHLLDGENLRVHGDGGRVCRVCDRERRLRQRAAS
jgi:WhiB family redox-sensing transcriptional regulator